MTRRPAGEDAFSLVETMVASVVGLLVVGATSTMVTASLRTNQASVDRVDSVNAARLGVEAVGRALRTTIRPSQLGDLVSVEPPVIEATSVRLRFYANIDNATETTGPSRVTYDLTGGQLTQWVQRPNAPLTLSTGITWCDDTLASCSVTRTVLATNVRSGSSFAYYGSDGAVLSSTGSGLDATGRDTVTSVGVRLVVGGSGSSGSSSALTRVQLVNQDAYRTTGTSS